MDPRRSGLYLRYQLLVTYLLDGKGISVRELLSREFDAARLAEEILGVERRQKSRWRVECRRLAPARFGVVSDCVRLQAGRHDLSVKRESPTGRPRS